MKTLCIQLCASYQDQPEWTQEIKNDSATVKEVLSDHQIIDIFFPVRNDGKHNIHDNYKLIKEGLASIDTTLYENCHIVINTHGRAGASDISNQLIKLILIKLSEMGIKVHQISALQCNGFKVESREDIKKRQPMMPEHQHVSPKISALDRLARGLNKIKLNIPQKFNILGFSQAYNTQDDKQKVVKLLRGESEDYTAVFIDHTTQNKLSDILEHIEICRENHKKIEAKKVTVTQKNPDAHIEYTLAGNKLAKVLQEINENIHDYLEGHDLKPSSVPLFESVKSFAKLSDKPSTKQYYAAYQSWKKTYKLCDDERLKIMSQYCSIELESEPGTPQSVHPKEIEGPSKDKSKASDAADVIACHFHPFFFSKGATCSMEYDPKHAQNGTFRFNGPL